MKPITAYLILLLSLAVLFGIYPTVFAAQEASSIMCDNGVVNIGDAEATVQDTCGEPNSKTFNEWV